MNKEILHCGPGLVIGIPTLGRPVPLDWALNFKGLNPPINYNTIFQVVKGQEVAVARQAIAELAVEKDAKYLFFIGDDTVVPSYTLRQLIYRMEQDPTIGVVGGVYCAKANPPFPLVFRGNGVGSFWDWKIGEFFEVTGLGMDCTLIRVDLLRKMEKPWFRTVSDDQFLDGKNLAEEWTEDLYFFKKMLAETQYKVFCDGGVICEHHDVYGGKKYGLPADSLPMRQKLTVRDKKLLMIGSMQIDRADEFDITTFGAEGSDYRGQIGQMPFDSNQFDWVVCADIPTVNFAEITELLRVTKTKLTLTFNPYLDLFKIASEISDAHPSPTIEKNMMEFYKQSV